MTHAPLRTSVLLATALVGLGVPASAQLTPIGPFTGTDFEGFETQNTSGGSFPTCVADRAFNNQADLCSATGGAHITGGWGFACSIQEQAGTRLYGSTGGASTFTFDESVVRFGGYFATHNPSASDGVIHFYGDGGGLLFSDVITAPNDCTWNWNGWDFGVVQVKSIEILSNYSTGGYMLLDSMQADLVPAATGTPFCFCEGTHNNGPCGNNGNVGRGCANSAGGGAMLMATGIPSVANTSGFSLYCDGVVPGTPSLYIEGSGQAGGGAGTLFGDGLMCAGGQLQHMQLVVSGSGGTSSCSANIPAATGVTSGETRYYQLIYRDPNASPCGFGFNLTNGLAITWQP